MAIRKKLLLSTFDSGNSIETKKRTTQEIVLEILKRIQRKKKSSTTNWPRQKKKGIRELRKEENHSNPNQKSESQPSNSSLGFELKNNNKNICHHHHHHHRALSFHFFCI